MSTANSPKQLHRTHTLYTFLAGSATPERASLFNRAAAACWGAAAALIRGNELEAEYYMEELDRAEEELDVDNPGFALGF